MRQLFALGFLCLFVCFVTSELPGFSEALRNIKKVYPRLTEEEAREMVYIMHKRMQYLEDTGKIKDWETPLNIKASTCEPISIPPPTDNIHELKPGHVSIVASMGDSITAGFAASSSSLIGVKEWRGQSWSIGGDQNELTFPNTLLEFVGSLGLYGPSLGTGERDNPNNYLNGAVSGAVVQDMPGQAAWLVQQLAALGMDAVINQWKVVTIWIGGNNLCDVCEDPEGNSADVYETKLSEALTILSDIPRTFVNVVPSLDVTELSRFSSGFCKLLHPFECRCATSSEANQAIVMHTNAQYTERIKKLSAEWNARNMTDFAVVVQPFLINTQIPDETYLSSADCFHPSLKAHQAAAVALWNSMIAPASQKSYEWSPGEPIVCPDNGTKFWVN